MTEIERIEKVIKYLSKLFDNYLTLRKYSREERKELFLNRKKNKKSGLPEEMFLAVEKLFNTLTTEYNLNNFYISYLETVCHSYGIKNPTAQTYKIIVNSLSEKYKKPR